jgi:hypothetical protein
MRKKYIILIITGFLCISASTQIDVNSLKSVQGIWYRVNLPEYTNNSSSIKINKGFKSLNLEYSISEEKKNYISEYYIGFQDSSSYDIETINISKLREFGNYYTVISMSSINDNGEVTIPNFSTPEIVELDENIMWINYGKITMYERIYRLPIKALKILYLQGKQDKRNYLKEYLDIDVREIIVNKNIIYFEPDIPTKMYFIKGDVVTILEEKNKWLKVEYEGNKLITGWIKKKDVGNE